MTRAGTTATLIWALTALIAAIIAIRARYTADLSAFLPRRASATQSLLVEQLREGPAAPSVATPRRASRHRRRRWRR